MVKVKVCGITNLKDALCAVQAGCEALGFVFFKKSPRYIAPIQASRIIKKLPPRTIKIGVFVNARPDYIRKAARLCKLDMLQFHGDESPEFCAGFRRYKIIKSFRVKDGIDLLGVKKYKTFAYLFDSLSPGKFGGTAKTFDWDLLTKYRGVITRPVFLAGGLDQGNVAKAIKAVRPEWVDTCSGVETKPGIKNHAKVSRFIKKAISCGASAPQD
jgi:phosphoribosylanthranilate isomerase